MTFCGSVSNIEKLGYSTEIVCPDSVYNDYDERVKSLGGYVSSPNCTIYELEKLF